MSVFDWYNPSLKAGDPGFIKSNIGQMATYGANAGQWLTNLFTPSPESLAAGGLVPQTLSSSSPQPTSSPLIPTAQAQIISAPPGAPGNPAAAATQQASDLAKYFPNLEDVSSGITNNLAPVKYSISTNPTIDSGSFAPATTSDALSARDTAANGMLNGDSSGVPSTAFLQNLFSNYQNSAGDVTNSAAAMASQRLAQLHAVESAYTQGGMTTGGRDAAINDINQRFGNTFSTIEVGNQAANANLDAYSRFFNTFMKPSELSPGSTLVTPLGQPVYQGNGAAPATIMQTAQQLAQMAMQSGTMQYNPDGTPNLQPYLEQAQSYYQTHQVLGSNAGGMNSAQPNPQPNLGQQIGNEAQNTYQYGITAGLPPTLAGAVTQSPVTGDYYINGAKTGGIPDQAITSQSGRTGVGYVPSANVGNIQQLDIAIGQMQNVWGMAEKYLTPGLLGRIKGLTTNQANAMLQTDPGWAQFNAVRLQAIDYLKGLAQGGGFRTTQSEIDTAANSILSTTDNLESAKAKMDMAMKNINLAYREYLPTHKDTPLIGASGKTSSPNMIQTKVGAVDNAWFN